MKRPFYLFSPGRLCRHQNTLWFERDVGSEEDETDKTALPVEQVDSVYVFSEIRLNRKLVTFLAQQDIPLFFYDYYGHFTATLLPREPLQSGRLKIAQAQAYLTDTHRQRLASSIVEAGASNIGRNLKYFARRRDGDACRRIEDALSEVEQLVKAVSSAADIPTLMGVEGNIRRVYYGAWPAILGEVGEAFTFAGRDFRPPSNEVNALISFGNALCYSLLLRQIHRTALDPTMSFLHEPGDRRFSLALDLAEIFKPIYVDRAIFRLIRTRQIQAGDFEGRMGGVYLTEKGRKTFTAHWDERMRRTVKHRSLGRKVSYERIARMDCYRLVRHLLAPDVESYEPFRMWW